MRGLVKRKCPWQQPRQKAGTLTAGGNGPGNHTDMDIVIECERIRTREHVCCNLSQPMITGWGKARTLMGGYHKGVYKAYMSYVLETEKLQQIITNKQQEK